MQHSGFADILDRAATELLRLEELNRFPAALRVNPDMFDLMAGIRRRELDLGYPLMVLGLPVTAEASLGADDYRIVH